MIKLQDVSKHYKLAGDVVVKAVDQINLEVEDRKFAMIVGRSGSGKTTLLSLIGGLTKPTVGRVKIDDIDLWTLNDLEQSRLRAEKIGFVFQIPSLLPTMTVLDNLRLPAMFSRTDYDVGKRAIELLEMTKIPDKSRAYPTQLSVGQQKRVALARALMNSPKILLADEPTSDLDKTTEMEIMALLQKIHKESEMTIVMVTHNLELAKYGTQVYLMANGSLSQQEGEVIIT